MLSTAVECLVMCCLRSYNWVPELVYCGHHMFFPQCDCEYGFSELLLVIVSNVSFLQFR